MPSCPHLLRLVGCDADGDADQVSVTLRVEVEPAIRTADQLALEVGEPDRCPPSGARWSAATIGHEDLVAFLPRHPVR
jgi:hypothetical protein